MLFDDFMKLEVFPYERPKWAGSLPVVQPGEGDTLESDYRMPSITSTPNNIVMRDQYWGAVHKPGPGIPYPVIFSNPTMRKCSPDRWNYTDWREFFSPIIIGYIFGKPFGRLSGEAYNRKEFREYVGTIPEVEEYYDRVKAFKETSYYHNLFTWRAIELQMGWNVNPPSWYTPKVSSTLNKYLSYTFD